jgi:predicted PurR-regulated permease PerM
MNAPEETPAAERRREWRLAGIIFFGLITLLILYAVGVMIRGFLSAIAVGAILVTVTYPLFERVRDRLKGHAGRAAIVMLIGITFVLIIPATILCIVLIEQATTLAQHLRAADAQQMMARIDLAGRLEWLHRYVPSFDPSTISAQRIILPLVQNIPEWVAQNGGALLGRAVDMVLNCGLILLSSYYFYVEGATIMAELRALSPMPARYDDEFVSRFKDVIDATFRGQVLTSLAQAVTTGIGLAVAGVPGALLWGAVTMVVSLLPVVGAAAVWGPAAIYLWIAASMGTRGYFGAIFLTAWGLLIVSTIDHVVRPWAMRGKAQLPAVPLLFAILGGLQAFGFIGLVVGPLVLSLLMSIIGIYKRSFSIHGGEQAEASE